jgi:hypothetical protein
MLFSHEFAHAPKIAEVPLLKLADSVFSAGFDGHICSRGGIGAVKDQDAGTGGRLEVESGNGGGMDSSVEIAKVFHDEKKCVE